MGLFSFSKNKKEENRVQNNQPEKDISEIKITSTDEGSHGDHFGGMIGFELMHSEEGPELVYSFIHYAEQQSPMLHNGAMNLRDAILNEMSETTERLKVRAIHTGENIPSAFPYLKTSYVIPFETLEIREWSQTENVEAEIYGKGRDAFALGFFATDYAIHKEIYKTKKNVEVQVSAIGLTMEQADLSENSNSKGLKFAKGFATYMPNNNLPGVCYYDFIGELVDFEEMIVIPDPEVSGYMTKIKLINHEDSDFFTIEMFVNKNNVQIPELKKGMSVSGSLWMQGEINA